MKRQTESLVQMANRTLRAGVTMRASSAAVTLNHQKIRSSLGRAYDSSGRGIYTVIRHAWRRLRNAQRFSDADAVALAFVKADGTYAYL